MKVRFQKRIRAVVMLIEAIIVIFATVIVYVFGMYVMANIDRWVRKEESEMKEVQQPDSAIVFGQREVAKVIGNHLESQKIQKIYIHEICFQKDWGNVEYLFAVSESDVDNLSICNLGKKFYHLKGLFGICNDAENHALYRQAGIELIQPEIMTKQMDNILNGRVCGTNESTI